MRGVRGKVAWESGSKGARGKGARSKGYVILGFRVPTISLGTRLNPSSLLSLQACFPCLSLLPLLPAHSLVPACLQLAPLTHPHSQLTPSSLPLLPMANEQFSMYWDPHHLWGTRG